MSKVIIQPLACRCTPHPDRPTPVCDEGVRLWAAYRAAEGLFWAAWAARAGTLDERADLGRAALRARTAWRRHLGLPPSAATLPPAVRPPAALLEVV